MKTETEIVRSEKERGKKAVSLYTVEMSCVKVYSPLPAPNSSH